MYQSEISPIGSDVKNKIKISPFIGVAPKIYRKIFQYEPSISEKKRNDATLLDWIPNISKW